ncbi:acetyl-CoA carboxylase carboxyl transferase subunit alpha [Buchnera aphidicola (Neophyllaphis podocarpi)]|uniref:acetyl-CoA carboxylase carboxyl transferase subunit alpha n=1 Tax=Buchnera aphidicola TaxID=9 RepID=UPI0031B7F9A8
MTSNYLDFEKPIQVIDSKINLLKNLLNNCDSKVKIFYIQEIKKLNKKNNKLIKKIFINLNSWEIIELSRHPLRPYTLDYIKNIFTDFDQLHGDRMFSDDKAIIGGIARLNNIPVMVLGHQKGRELNEKIYHNFGMPFPEGYRKSLRLMKMAAKFNMPIITFIDTPGADPGIGAEERNQSEAIANNLIEIPKLNVPIICTVIGEGGSGGALAIGIGDKINMLQYSTYSVISPEGCASILWKNINKAQEAAQSMKITSVILKKLKLIDSIIFEPLGGAHRNPVLMFSIIKKHLISDLNSLNKLDMNQLLRLRYNKIMNYTHKLLK